MIIITINPSKLTNNKDSSVTNNYFVFDISNSFIVSNLKHKSKSLHNFRSLYDNNDDFSDLFTTKKRVLIKDEQPKTKSNFINRFNPLEYFNNDFNEIRRRSLINSIYSFFY
uniref:Uncharacterized protein n=1 Tax=Hygrophorus russula TaxID=264141 RepID=A0A346LZL8_9AGAR|nr:hypothetical protein [Hygrophorus russula]AXQ02213.1 hypothetical protein [Hygrophorus russula]